VANPAIVVDFIANTRDLQKGMSQATGATSGFGDKLKTLGKVAGAAALGGLVATLKIGAAEFANAAKVGAQTNSVLKSTGGVAGVTASQVGKLSESLMKKSGVDDEAIQSGENMLLTFTNIRNEVGKGNDIFSQATTTMTDMSVALGQDMKSSALQLGKALNDPVKGMTALQRVGVSFTQAQKDQVKALVDSGRTLDAQKLILKELNKEFGGSAEAVGKTLPGQLNIAKQEFSNFAGTVVGTVLPPLTAMLKLLMDHKAILVPLVAIFGTLTAAVIAVNLATKAWAAMQAIATAAQWAWNAAMTANPIGLIIAGIAALIAAGVLLVKNWDTVKKALTDAFNAIAGVASNVFDWFKKNWPLLLAIITGPIGLATLAIVRNWQTIRDTFMSGVTAVKNAVVGAWDTVKQVTLSVWNAIAGFISDTINTIRSLFTGLASWISAFASGAWTTALNAVKAVFGRIEDAARAVVQAVKDAFNGLVGFIDGIVGKVAAAATSVANAIKAPINAVINAWNGLRVPGFHVNLKMPGPIPDIHFGWGGIDLPDIPKLARGGVVDTPTVALLGEGAGREIVAPEALLRQLLSEQRTDVRVFIGETELTSIVDTRIAQANTGLARSLLAGGSGG